MNHNVRNFILFVLMITLIRAQDPIVNLPQGRIVGTKVYTEKSLTPIEIYYGIPYAIPPIGRYRFSAPERHTGWRRTFYAHRLPPHCPHVGDINSETTNYSEDCLFVNIWTPRPLDGKPLPVLVMLYSESWTRGGVPLPCQDLAAEDIVVVTVGYRLHLLGFFTLGSISARGNLALLDQYLALLWIRDNIAAFGGNSNAITVLGHSAGADSVLHHLISPRPKGLFHRAVIMSPIDIWKMIDEQNNKVDNINIEGTSREVALSLGCTGNSDLEILSCMRTRPLSDILSVYSNMNWSKSLQPIPEKYLPETEQYLPTTWLTALSSNKQSVMQVDLLLGTTDLDALNYNDETFYDLLKYNASYVSEYMNSKTIPELLRMFSLHHRPEVLPMLIRAVRWEYCEGISTSSMQQTIEKLSRMESSARWSAGGALLAARLARHVARLYVYRYSLPSTVDLEGRRLNYTGAVHGSDLISLLGDSIMLQIARRPTTSEEKRYSSIFRQYIVNFVKNGYPASEDKWQHYKPRDAQIFEIHDESVTDFNSQSAHRDIKFWLQYLPELSSLFKTLEQTEQLITSEGDDGRLRGGVFAMCGVAIVLILLLCSSTILLHRQRLRRRISISDDVQN